MNTTLSLIDVITYIPEYRPLVSEIIDEVGITSVQAKIYERIYKLHSVPIAQESSQMEFLIRPIRVLLERYPGIQERVQLIIYAHTSAITTEFGASVIQDIKRDCGFDQALTFGTTLNKCVASIKALEIADQFLSDKESDALGLIVSGEICYSDAIRHIPSTSIGGDAAIAVLVSKKNGKHKLLKTGTFTDGRFAKGMWMNNKELAEYDSSYIQVIVEKIKSVLSELKLNLNDIDLILPHNINIPSWQKVATTLGMPLDKIYLSNIPKTAHTLGADVFLNLDSAYREKRLRPGMKSMMVSVGLGASYGYAIWEH